MFRFTLGLLACSAFSALVGCGGGYKPESGITVKGKITQGGQPLTVPNMAARVGTVKIEFVPVHSGPDDNRSTFGTLANEDGTFEVHGAGQGIKAGKYKVSVIADPGNGTDQLKGKYKGAASPIEVEIVEGKKGGIQDLGTISLE